MGLHDINKMHVDLQVHIKPFVVCLMLYILISISLCMQIGMWPLDMP